MNGGQCGDEAFYVVNGGHKTKGKANCETWKKLKVKVHSQVFVLNLMIYFLVSGNNLKNVIDWLG